MSPLFPYIEQISESTAINLGFCLCRVPKKIILFCLSFLKMQIGGLC